MESEETPPTVVVVQGPAQSGKSTLIRSIIYHFTGKILKEFLGPITIRCGKDRRITLIECPNNMGAMIDLGKAADLTLILIDASIGFEMETFEYLTILQSHGMPNIMGVLTHLDFFRAGKNMTKTRKKIKTRFE